MYILYAPIQKYGRLAPETPLFCPDIKFTNNLATCTQRYWLRVAKMHGIENVTPQAILDLNKELKPQSILLLAEGGIGDILWATTAARALKEKYPHARINVNTTPAYIFLWINNPYVSGYSALPHHVVTHAIYAHEEVIDFSGCVAGGPEGKKRHAVDIFLERAGIEEEKKSEQKLPFLRITKKEKLAARDTLGKLGIDCLKDKIIGLHLESSAPSRSWPYVRSQELTEKLCAEGYKVLFFGTNKDFEYITGFQCKCGENFEFKTKNDISSIQFICAKCRQTVSAPLKKRPSGAFSLVNRSEIRQTCALISQLNLFIGPDSGLLQVAVSQNIPSVGLYGPFDAKLRTAYFDKHRDIQGSCKDGPCMDHKGYCKKGYPSPCMLDIPVELVYQTADKLLEAYPIQRREKWQQYDVDSSTIKRQGNNKNPAKDIGLGKWERIRSGLRFR